MNKPLRAIWNAATDGRRAKRTLRATRNAATDVHRVNRTLRATLNTDIDRHRVYGTLRATLNAATDRHRVNRTEGSFRFIHNFLKNSLLVYIIYVTKITNIHNKFTCVSISIRLNVQSFQKTYSLLLT